MEQFVPEIHFETVLKLEKLPLEPEYQRSPEYFLPPDIKKIPVFEVRSIRICARLSFRDSLSDKCADVG